MQFFKAEAVLCPDSAMASQDRMSARRMTRKIEIKTEEFNLKLKGKGFFCVQNLDDDIVSICALIVEDGIFDKQLKAFLKYQGFEIQEVLTDEITFATFQGMLLSSSREGYIEDDDDVLESFGLDRLSGRWGVHFDFGESFIEESSKEELNELCTKYLATESVLPEIERIYKGNNTHKVIGHPVHYFLETDDRDIRKQLYRGLLSALYANGRINNRRYTYINFGSSSEFSRLAFDALYNTNIGGAMVIRFTPASASANSEDDEYDSNDRSIIQAIGEKALKYRNKVLTIICLPRSCNAIKAMLYEALGDMCFVELHEDLAASESAVNFLKYLAKDNSIRTDKKLFAEIKEDTNYTSSELREIFESWYDKKLRSTIYPQYKMETSVKKEVQKAVPKGTAYERLQEMVGLTAAKEVIDNALNFYKSQKMYEQMGVKKERVSMHLCFTGNPGTAKTSVARLFAEILKDNGILSRGHLVEVGREGLIAKYVGQTAPLVKKAFKSAMGGVLFIDEAYSLANGDPFAEEALAAICAEMENNRNDLVVIMAGYPDEMEKLLNANPGLRSRIAFHVPFEDYSVKELCDISKLIAKDKGLVIDEAALNKLEDIFKDAVNQPEFGAGRGVRNIIEKSQMKQASRLVKMDVEKVTKEDVITLKAEDIAEIENKNTAKSNIGFCA